MHLLCSGSRRLGRGVGGQSHACTRSVPPRTVCARPLHAGASGQPRARACRLDLSLRRVPLGMSGGSRPPHPGEFARGLPMTESEGMWAALRGTMQFGEFLLSSILEPAFSAGSG